jgi:hypothetical protein
VDPLKRTPLFRCPKYCDIVSHRASKIDSNLLQTLLPFFLDTAEVAALISRHTLKFSIHRVNPFVLIGLDAIAIGLLVWSFFMLIFDKWGKTQIVSTIDYTADPFNGIEIWLAVTLA